MWFFGEPVGDLYPPGQDLWVVFWRALTLGQLSWNQTYGLAFVSYYALSAVVLYEFGRRHLSRAAGLVAALCWLLDPGGWEEGGWSYLVFYGVWGQSLGMALYLAGLSRTLTYMERGERRHLGAAGLLFGVGHLCHPTNLLLAALTLPALILLGGKAGPEEGRRAALTTGLGLAVGACFWLPFLGRDGYTMNIGFLGADPRDVLLWTLEGHPFVNWLPGMGYLALLGTGLLLARRHGEGPVLAVLFLGLLATAAGVLTHLLHLHELLPNLSRINFGRVSIAAKSFAFLMVGHGAATSLAWLSGWRTGQPSRQARAGLGVLLLSWLGLNLGFWAWRAPEDQRGLLFADEWPTWCDFQDYLRWSTWQREHSDRFYRIAYVLHPHDHRLMAAPIENHTPILKIGYTPASLYATQTMSDAPGLLERASVRYVLSDRALRDPRFTLLRTFGALRLYEVATYSPVRFTLYGGGLTRVRRFDDEAIAIELRDTDPAGRLLLHMGNFPRWQITIDGQPVTSENTSLWRNGPAVGLGVPARDGLVVLRYVRRGVDWAGDLSSAVALIAVLWLTWSGRLRRPVGQASRSN